MEVTTGPHETQEAKELNQLPTVSVIIAYYNHDAFLAETVRSVNDQTYPKVEVIVVDDGSPVSARSILGEINNVKIVRTENRGCPAARNRGFHLSSGKYLVFLDSDDRLVPGAIEAQVTFLERRPQAALSFGAYRRIDETGKEIAPPNICRPRNDYFLMFLETNPIACPGAAMLRRDAFVEVGLFDESFRIVEDYHLYLRLLKRFPIIQHGACVVEYRSHANGLSRHRESMLKATMAALDRLERENVLSSKERRHLLHGRARWIHMHHPKQTLAYRIRTLYYNILAMRTVPLRSYLGSDRTTR